MISVSLYIFLVWLYEGDGPNPALLNDCIVVMS